MADEIEVTVGSNPDAPPERAKSAVVMDRKGGRAWSAEAPTESEAATKALRGFLGDRRAREYVGS